MSMFYCVGCDDLCDADDGCDEAAPGSCDLICADCMAEREAEAEEADDRRRANPLEPGFRRIG